MKRISAKVEKGLVYNLAQETKCLHHSYSYLLCFFCLFACFSLLDAFSPDLSFSLDDLLCFFDFPPLLFTSWPCITKSIVTAKIENNLLLVWHLSDSALQMFLRRQKDWVNTTKLYCKLTIIWENYQSEQFIVKSWLSRNKDQLGFIFTN